MKGFKRLLSLILTSVMILGLVPMEIVAADISDPGYVELNDGFLSVRVSKENGGFLIDTLEGNKLNKSDNNKFLLYPDEDFDTSYTSFRVTRNGKSRDYIFGREYGFLGVNSSDVTVTADDTSITAVWSVDDLEFTQNIALLDTTSNQHGMAYITYQVKNTGETADIQARVLMDTALGYQDYAVYELTQEDGTYTTVESEQILPGDAYNSSFFAYDNEFAPSVMAYIVNATVSDRYIQPDRIAFGHWNNLASTVFDYAPDSELYFTNPLNNYLTADSAFAMYYDMGTAVSGDQGTAIGTYYGVYSNATIDTADSVAINFEMPAALTVNEDGTGYDALVQDGESGTFVMNVRVTNISDQVIDQMAVALYPEEGLVSYDTENRQNTDASHADPYYLQVIDLIPGEERAISIPFAAIPASSTQYRKIGVRCFDLSGTEGAIHLREEKVLGERDAYILCPGGTGTALSFTGMTPEAVFVTGTRTLNITGTNFVLLRQKEDYNLVLRPMDGRADIIIPDEKVFVDTNENTIEVVVDQELTEGTWQAVFDWTDTTKIDATGDALRFVVGDSPAFKNQAFGVVVIEYNPAYNADTDNTNMYRLRAFASEADYDSFYSTVDFMDCNLMEFRGSFSLTYEGQTIVGAKAIAVDGGDSINISNCLDVDNGTLEITVDGANTADQEILVDIDGEVYTTGARTKVWDGVCALSTITNNTILGKYNKMGTHLDGNVENSEANKDAIMLCWPGAASGAQTLAGMVMEFRYAEFGRMYYDLDGSTIKDDSPSKYVIAFGAEVSPDFLVPNTYVYDKAEDAKFAYYQEQNRLAGRPYVAEQIRDVNERNREEVKKMMDSSSGSFAIALHDILFGGGFIGVNASVDIEVPSYTQGMPALAGSLNIRIMGEEWSMRVEGTADFVIFEMEGSLGLKSYNSIPVPDEISFFMGGFTPGINVDGFGVFWIRGLGGGVKDIYNTIFTASVLPPLTILFKGQFALFSVLSATTELAMSARGFSVAVDNIGLDLGTVSIDVLKHLGASVYWYPKIRFNASIELNVLDILTGYGSMLLEQMEHENGETYYFWEGFANAGIQVPGWVPFIPNYQIANVDLGVNPERMWGAFHVLGIDAGVTYYWGEDGVEFAFGKYDAPEATVAPLALFSVPVYRNADDGSVLYMSMYASSAGLSETEIDANASGTAHTFTLDESAAGTEDAMITVSYAAFTETEARSTFAVSCNGAEYPLVWMQGTDTSAPENENANASFLYTPSETEGEAGRASVTFTVSNKAYFGKEFSVTTPNASAVQIFGMPRRADLDTVTVNDNTASVTGSIGMLDKLKIYACGTDGFSYLLYEGAASETVDLSWPAIMPSGTYTIRAIGTTTDESANPIAEQEKFEYVNPNAPAAPVSASAKSGGDYTIDVTVTEPAGEFDGYLVTVYDEDGKPTIYQNMTMDKDSTVLTVGGRYEVSVPDYDESEESEDDVHFEGGDLVYGLEAGKAYTVGVRTYRQIGEEEGTYLPSDEVMTDPVTITKANKPEVTLRAEGAVTHAGMDTIGDSNAVISVTADQTLENCRYCVDGGEWAESDGGSISLKDLADGGHKITLRGENAQGDGFETMYAFTVHASEPVLMLASPSDGDFFTDSVTVSGISDPGAEVTVSAGDKTVTASADENGRFCAEIALDSSYVYQTVTVQAENIVGNTSREITLTLANELLGADNLRAVILANGEPVLHLTEEHNGAILTMALKSGDKILTINPESSMAYRINWEVLNVSGQAVLSDNGKIAGITAESNGMAAASLGALNTGVVIGGNQDVATGSLTLTASETDGVISIMVSALNGLQTLTVNGWTPAENFAGKTVFTCEYTAEYAGDYIISVTDSTDETKTKTVTVTGKSVVIAENAVTAVNTESETVKTGSVTLAADSVTGGTYDTAVSKLSENKYAARYLAALVPVDSETAEADLTDAVWVNAEAGKDTGFTGLGMGWYRIAVKTEADAPVLSEAVYVGAGLYQIQLPEETTGGTVTVENLLAEPGTTVTVTLTPDEGWLPGEITVTGSDGEPIEVTDNGDGTFSFVMPEGSVVLGASFTEDPFEKITVNAGGNVTVAADTETARAGDTVTLTVTPDEGYELYKITVTDKNGTEIPVSDIGDGRYTFVMPDSAAEVDVVAIKTVIPSDLALECVVSNGTIVISASMAQGLETLTINDWSPEEITGKTEFTYEYTAEYAGAYVIRVTDTLGESMEETVTIEKPLSAADSALSVVNTESPDAATGSVTLAASSITGGSYDREASVPAENKYAAGYQAALIPVDSESAEADLTDAVWVKIDGETVVFDTLGIGWYRVAVKTAADETVLTEAVYVGADRYAVQLPGEVVGGTAAVSDALAVPGDPVTVKLTPDEGYLPGEITVTGSDGKPVEVTDNGDGTHTFLMPDGPVQIAVSFTEDPVKEIKLNQPANAKVEADADRAKAGDTVTVTVTPDKGYDFDAISITDSEGNAVTVTDLGDGRYSFVMPDDNVNVSVSVVKNRNSDIIVPKLFKLTASAGEGGTITPAGDLLIAYGASRTFRITAEKGYEIADVLVNGVSVGAVSRWTVKAAAADITVEAVFRRADGQADN